MSKKEKIVMRSPEEMEASGVDYAEELYLDMNRSAQLLSVEHQEVVDNARALLEETLGRLSSHIPEEGKAKAEDIVRLTRLVATALKARNTIRYCFLKSDGYEMAESVDMGDTVH